MSFALSLSRRQFIRSTSALAAGLMSSASSFSQLVTAFEKPLEEFSYGDVTLASEVHNQQLDQTHSVLMELSEDSLLKPFRRMVGQPAPGEELGGWYLYDPNYDWHTFDAGFAPAATFGQWVSALARTYAIRKDERIRDKVLRLNRLYAKTIAGDFYTNNRFPAYCYDKLVCGLIDSHQFVGDPEAYRILEHTTDTALPHLPPKAIEQGQSWRPGKDESYTWDESYTMPENLFLAYQRGAGDRYRALGQRYLHDAYFDPLVRGENSFAGRHAYSHINALCSAMQGYLTLGSEKHLRAARNAFHILQAQSFVTGAWGPDETLRADKSDDLYASLSNTHNSFETPCGAYAHFKLTRYLLGVTRDSVYGDSMERMMYNTVLGAKPMAPDGRTFYYSDYNFKGRKVYCDHRWPCCSGTLPQVAADYRINTYLRDDQGIYVNLFIPSTVRWKHNGAEVSLTQSSAYPFDETIHFEVKAPSQPEFAVRLRIPAWAERASISVNGMRQKEPVMPARFAALRRRWKTGDRIELELPLTRRLEAVNPLHPRTVAVLQGPLVLFAITGESPRVTGRQLLAAKKIGPERWSAETSAEPLPLLPFTAIADEQYSTYVNVDE